MDKGKSGQVEGKEGDVQTGGPVPTLSTVTKHVAFRLTNSFIPLSLFSLFPYSLFLLAGLLILLVGCSQSVPASMCMMDDAEARWQTDPVPSYHIVVDVDRLDDRRRTELIVRQGEIVEATVKYWDFGKKRWQEPYDLNYEQAFPFTVPGLFDMVRGELRGSGRADVRVVMEGEPAFPHRIVLGPVWGWCPTYDLRPVDGTEATVTVREFEVLRSGID